jgi:hypothetical protein
VFALRQLHKYSDSDIMDWIPFERDIYVEMLMAYLEKEKLKKQ